MENLRSIYGDEEEEEEEETSNNDNGEPVSQSQPTIISTLETTKTPPILTENNDNSSSLKQQSKEEAEISEEISEIELSEDDNDELPTHKQLPSEKFTTTVSDDDEEEEEEEEVEAEGEGYGEGEGEEEQEEEEEEGDEVEDENSPRKKQKSLASFTPFGSPPKIIPSGEEVEMEEVEESKKSVEKIPPTAKILKKPKKKTNKANSVWTKSTSRKGKKKNKSNNTNGNHNNNNNYHNVDAVAEESVLITPIHRFPDKNDDSPDMKICLSKVYKAEKVELSDDRFSAGSSKGYRMVRATRGVVEGAWYFEIRVLKLGETGHTRLGWSTEKGDLQAPVGYDGNSFGYRDVDGSKVHKAVREKYGEEGYVEGDVIGCYINLPEGNLYAPNPTQLFWFKGQKYSSKLEAKEESPQVVPGSEICFFRNGIFQGVAFKDLCGGRYYPAASMYTLPNQPNCVVKFNFGPDFEFLPQDFGDRPKPTPMVEVPYQGFDGRPENGESLEKKQ